MFDFCLGFDCGSGSGSCALVLVGLDSYWLLVRVGSGFGLWFVYLVAGCWCLLGNSFACGCTYGSVSVIFGG